MNNTTQPPVSVDNILINLTWQTIALPDDETTTEIEQEAKQQLYDLFMEIIGPNEKPNTLVQRYPGSIAPGTKRATKLSDTEKARNELRSQLRQAVNERFGRE